MRSHLPGVHEILVVRAVKYDDSLGARSRTGLNNSSAHPPVFPPAVVLLTSPCTSYILSLVVNIVHAVRPFPPLAPSRQNPNEIPVIGR